MLPSTIEVKNEFPPNYDTITSFFPVDKQTVYAFGSCIYNPHKLKIPLDIEIHEAVHIERQKQFQSPFQWWNEYCINKEFRLLEEIEAYGKQYYFLKRHLPSKGHEEALREMSNQLSSPLYKLDITNYQAQTFIRHKAKQHEKEYEKNYEKETKGR